VAGHYGCRFNGVDVGTTEVGFYLQPDTYIDPIRVDEFGDAVVDGIFRGQNLNLTFQLHEFGAAGRALCQFPMVGIQGANDQGSYYVPGVGQTVVGSGRAYPILLTPIIGINSRQQAYLFPLCMPHPNHGGFNLNTRKAVVSANLQVLVNRNTGLLFQKIPVQ
jgi:hypothetical protein